MNQSEAQASVNAYSCQTSGDAFHNSDRADEGRIRVRVWTNVAANGMVKKGTNGGRSQKQNWMGPDPWLDVRDEGERRPQAVGTTNWA